MEDTTPEAPPKSFLPRLRFHLPLDPARLSRARERIRDYLQAHCADTHVIDEIVLAVEEACTNAIQHSGADKNVVISLMFQAADLVADVRDFGSGFDVSTFDPMARPDPLSEHGRGLFLIARLMDELDLRLDHGLSVRMVKRNVLDRFPRLELVSELGTVDAADELVRLETRRRTLLEEIDEAFMALDWEYRIVHVNASALALLERQRRSVLGRTPWDVDPEIQDTPLARAFVDAMELGRSTILEQRRAAGGDWLEVRVYPTQSGASVYMRNINERKRVERQRDHLLRRVASERSRLASVLKNMTEAVIVADPQAHVMEMNAAALAMHGAQSVHEARRGFERAPDFDLSTLDGRPLEPGAYPLARVTRGERFVDVELLMHDRRSGATGVWSFSGAPVANERGETELTVLTIRDVTERRRTEEERDRALEELESERARLRDILEALPVGVGLVDADGTVLEINEANHRVWAGPLPKAQSIEEYSLYVGRHHDTGEPMLPYEWPAPRVVVTGEPAEELVDIERLDGSTAVADIRAVPVLDEDGSVCRIVVLTEDVTEQVGRERLNDALNEISRLVHSARDIREVLTLALQASCRALGTESGVILLREGDWWVIRYQYGFDRDVLGDRFEDSLVTGLLEAAESGPVVLPDLSVDEHGEETPAAADYGVLSALAVPLHVEGGLNGLMFLDHTDPADFSEAQIDFGRKLGESVSLALENASVYEREHEAMRLADVLSQVEQAIHSSLEFDEIVQRALDEGVKALGAESAALSLHQPGFFKVGYVNGFPPESVGTLIRDELEIHGLAAMDTGETIAVDDAETDQRVRPELMRDWAIRSVICAPLVVKSRPIAVLYYNYVTAKHRFSSMEIEFVRRLASSLSLALENARLFDELRHIAVTLQESLIHPLAAFPGLAAARVSETASKPELVGGDFSDVFAIPGGRVAVLIGDVEGKGVVAAGLTETVRSSVRALALVDPDPAAVLRRTNELLLDPLLADGQFVTAFLMVLDTASGKVVYSSAGHPAPLLVGDGLCGFMQVRPGLPLGVLPGSYEDAEVRLERHQTLVLYTDGVIEARPWGGPMFGERRLRDAVCDLHGEDVEAVAARLRDATVRYAGRLKDDVQILTLRLLPTT